MVSFSVSCNIVTLLLCNYPSTCDGSAIENGKSSTNENVSHPEVRIPQGTIRGIEMHSQHNRTFFGFKGIPYAEPPVGDLRFHAPIAAGPWNGTLDGSRDTAQCPQVNDNILSGDEDCLYLNVYTPQLPENENSTLLPVMMFIYGGQFKTGTNHPSRWSPRFILDKDVVFVAPSYRMGALGYLSTGDQVAPGNYALKDLVQALKWNRDNIKNFGGDPKKVTVFGGSSGAGCVQLLTLTNLTNGLFHRYITQSGGALGSQITISRRRMVNRTIRLGTHLGCPTMTSTSLVNCLRGLNTSQLSGAESIFHQWDRFPCIVWGPTIEDDVRGAILTDTPANLLAAGKSQDLPWICTLTRDEGIVYSALFYEKPDIFQDFLDEIDIALPQMAQYHGVVENVTAYTDALKSYYLNDLTADRNLLLTNFTILLGDSVFVYPSYSALQHHLVHAKNPRYLFSFEYRGTVSYSYFFSGGSTKNYGVAHADDLLYLIPGPKALFGPPGYENSDADWNMVETMVQLWTSFAIDGIPSTLDSNCTRVLEPYSTRDNYLQIGNGPDTTLRIKHGFNVDRMRFWKELSDATSRSIDVETAQTAQKSELSEPHHH